MRLGYSRYLRNLTLAVSLLALAACGGSPVPPGITPPPSNPTPPPGGDGYRGTLIAEGTGNIHTLDLGTRNPADSDPWVSRDTATVYEEAAVVLSQNEILIAGDSFGSLMTVEVKDLTTFGLKESFEWSDDESVGRVNALAASRDGRHLAALLEGLGRPYLEVLSRDDKTVVYSGLDIVSDDTLAWTPNDELVLALDLSAEGNPERWGAIGAIPLERFYAADERITIDLYATFTRAEWDAGVGDIALSSDGSQLAYTRGSDLWVMDFVQNATPHQLTTGPIYHGGAQFSPDGTAIAFAAGGRYGLKETYIIPNHRNEPLFIDVGQNAGDEYLIGVDTLVDSVLAWAP